MANCQTEDDALLTRSNTEFHLPNGDVVTLPTEETGLRVRSQAGQTQELSLANVLKQWLPDDSKWNGHTFGNYIRYTNSHDGLTVGLDDAMLFNGALLAILTTHSAGGSGQALKSQQLVRVETAPVLKLTMLQCLDVPDGSPYTIPRHLSRLFVWNKRLLLLTHPGAPDDLTPLSAPDARSNPARASELVEINTNGKMGASVARFPQPLYPFDIVANRWLVLGTGPNTQTRFPVWVHDMERHISMPVPGDWQCYNGESSLTLPSPGNTLPYLAMEVFGTDQGNSRSVIVVHLPDGKRSSIALGRADLLSVLLWNGLIVAVDMSNNRVHVYDVTTGKRVKTLSTTSASTAGASANINTIVARAPANSDPAMQKPQDTTPVGKTVTLSINGTRIADAYKVQEEVLVPLYAAIPMGLEPHINAATGVITLQKPGLVFRLKLGSRSAACNGKPFTLFIAPRLDTTSPDSPDSEADTDARLPPLPFVPIFALAHRLKFNVCFNPNAGDVGALYNLSNQDSHTRSAPSTVPTSLPRIVPPNARHANNLAIYADLHYGNPGAFDPAKPSSLDTTGITLSLVNWRSMPIVVSDRHVFIELANGRFNTADQTDTLHGNPYRTLRVVPNTLRLLNISPFSGRLPVKRIVYMDGWNFCEWKTEPAATKPAATKPKPISRQIMGRFCKAIEEDDVAGVRKGLRCGIPINEFLPFYNQTPLMMAAEYASLDVFNFLLAQHADTSVRNVNNYSGGITALRYAITGSNNGTETSRRKAETRRIAMLRMLMARGLRLDERDQNGGTSLMWLVNSRIKLQAIWRFALHNGADINARNDEGESALHLAVSVEMARLLLDAGADPNIRNKSGATPLILAANIYTLNYSLIQLLLDRGAAINARDDQGRTPLIRLLWDACISYLPTHTDNENEEKPPSFTPPRDDCLRLLLRKGADLNTQDKEGKTALDWAKATLAECETDEHRKQAQHIIDILLGAGATR